MGSAIIPPKVENFLWRLLNNALPTRVRLQERGLDIDPRCPKCERNETREHALLECDKARKCWELLGHPVPGSSNNDISCWLERTVRTASAEGTTKIFCCMWRLWLERNKFIWHGTVSADLTTIFLMRKFLTELQQANEIRRRGLLSNDQVSSIARSGTPPEAGHLEM